MHSCIIFIIVFVGAHIFVKCSDAEDLHPENDDFVPVLEQGREKRNLDDSLKQQTLMKHNTLRAGEGSSSMKKMIWNDILADMALAYTEACVLTTGTPQGFDNAPYQQLGQNLFYTTGAFDVNSAIDMWFVEKEVYNPQDNSCSDYCMNYKKIVWDSSFELGCGLTECNVLQGNDRSWDNAKFFVCYYGPRGQYSSASVRPYLLGEACTKCTDGQFACDGGLCSNKAMADCAECTCAADCKNNGRVTDDCRCECAYGFTGVDCSDTCVDQHDYCNNGWYYADCIAQSSAATVQTACPAMCCICTPAGGPSSDCFKDVSQQMLALHNELRSQVGAADMMKLEWSLSLENMAAEWVSGCHMKLGYPTDYQLPYSSISQNSLQSSTLSVYEMIQKWYSDDFYYNIETGECSSPSKCLLHKQLLFAKALEVGCAITYCEQLQTQNGVLPNRNFLVCYYGPAYDNGSNSPPYKVDEACTKCPYGHYACDGELCSSKEISACIDCTCKADCKNGGVVTEDCKCQCPPGFTGDDCSDECIDTDPHCNTNWFYSSCTGNDAKLVQKSCPAMCCVCVPAAGLSGRCERDYNACSTFTCYNGGTSARHGEICQCVCPTHTYGNKCQYIRMEAETGVILKFKTGEKKWSDIKHNLAQIIIDAVTRYCNLDDNFASCCPGIGEKVRSSNTALGYLTLDDLRIGSGFPLRQDDVISVLLLVNINLDSKLCLMAGGISKRNIDLVQFPREFLLEALQYARSVIAAALQSCCGCELLSVEKSQKVSGVTRTTSTTTVRPNAAMQKDVDSSSDDLDGEDKEEPISDEESTIFVVAGLLFAVLFIIVSSVFVSIGFRAALDKRKKRKNREAWERERSEQPRLSPETS